MVEVPALVDHGPGDCHPDQQGSARYRAHDPAPGKFRTAQRRGDGVGRTHGIDVHRALDVLHPVFARIIERTRNLAGDLVVHDARDRYPAHGRQRLQPRGDVDAFAIDVIAFDDDFAQIDADPVANASCLGAFLFGVGHRCLDLQCTVDGRDDASELDERTVAHELDQAPAMGNDTRIEDFASVDLQPFERAGLVGLHEPAVAGDVGRKYRGKSALHRSGHASAWTGVPKNISRRRLGPSTRANSCNTQ